MLDGTSSCLLHRLPRLEIHGMKNRREIDVAVQIGLYMVRCTAATTRLRADPPLCRCGQRMRVGVALVVRAGFADHADLGSSILASKSRGKGFRGAKYPRSRPTGREGRSGRKRSGALDREMRKKKMPISFSASAETRSARSRRRRRRRPCRRSWRRTRSVPPAHRRRRDPRSAPARR